MPQTENNHHSTVTPLTAEAASSSHANGLARADHRACMGLCFARGALRLETRRRMTPHNDDDALFRSHFTHVNLLADRSYEQVRDAYRLGQDAGADPQRRGYSFGDVEKDLENGWLNVRVGGGDWASVREFALAGFDRARQGSIPNAPPSYSEA